MLDVVVNYAGPVAEPPPNFVVAAPVFYEFVGWFLHPDGYPANFFVSPDTNCTPVDPNGGCLRFVQGLAPSVPTVCFTTRTYLRGPSGPHIHLVDEAPDFRSEACPESGGNALAISLGETAVIAD